jgi:flagellar biosynthesis protein FliQ
VDQAMVIAVGKQALQVTVLVCAPLLGFGLVAGLVVSILQAVTQIQDMTLTFIPKIVAVILALALFFPWMLSLLMEFTVQLLGDVTVWVR